MLRRLVAPLSGPPIGICGPHGIWFPPGRFERFCAFLTAGGLEFVPGEVKREPTEKAQRDAAVARSAKLRHDRQRKGGSGWGTGLPF